MSFFVLAVALIVDGEVKKDLVYPISSYDSLQACQAAAEKYDLILPLELNGSTFKFVATCVERKGAGPHPITQVV